MYEKYPSVLRIILLPEWKNVRQNNKGENIVNVTQKFKRHQPKHNNI
jgi:predicted secreted Zn-dependent protease